MLSSSCLREIILRIVTNRLTQLGTRCDAGESVYDALRICDMCVRATQSYIIHITVVWCVVL